MPGEHHAPTQDVLFNLDWLPCGNRGAGGVVRAEVGAQLTDCPGHPGGLERVVALEMETHGWTCSWQKRKELLDLMRDGYKGSGEAGTEGDTQILL